MTEWTRGNEREPRTDGDDLGGTMRLGAYDACSSPGSKIARIYGATDITSATATATRSTSTIATPLEAAGLKFSGLSPDGLLPEIVEREDHPWFVGVQFHPELKPALRPAPPVRQLHRRRAGAEPAGLERVQPEV